MGTYPSTPKTEKQSADGEGARVRYGLASMQGWRTTMEDAAVSELGAGAKSLLLSLEPPSSSDASGEYFFSDYGLGSQHIL
ncbi:hypothetical protein ZWY2020_027119 [Hordeum vulgare]|nr:hypothetical protein ZWY2020_027119 [Hordeum vulgare]